MYMHAINSVLLYVSGAGVGPVSQCQLRCHCCEDRTTITTPSSPTTRSSNTTNNCSLRGWLSACCNSLVLAALTLTGGFRPCCQLACRRSGRAGATRGYGSGRWLLWRAPSPLLLSSCKFSDGFCLNACSTPLFFGVKDACAINSSKDCLWLWYLYCFMCVVSSLKPSKVEIFSAPTFLSKLMRPTASI